MPANKNALIRYKTIDNCLRNHYRRWTLDDLVETCCDALYKFEGITKGGNTKNLYYKSKGLFFSYLYFICMYIVAVCVGIVTELTHYLQRVFNYL